MTRRSLIVVLAAIVVGQTSPIVVRTADGPTEVARLAALARVWGLLKYYHPLVAQGTSDWDGALVAEVPHVRAAASRAEFNDEIVRFIESVGTAPRVAADAPVDRPEADAAFRWIEDDQLFDAPTIKALKTVRHAVVPSTNRYVRPVVSVQNPDFSSEAPYDAPAYPSEGMRFLALARFWNMVQYYAPNRDITDRPWSDVLPAMVPRFIEAADAPKSHLAVCELTASLNDTHAATGSATLTSYWGANVAPIRTRFIESQTVVTAVFDRFTGGTDVQPGDIVTDVNDVPTADRRVELRKYVWASNEGSLQRNIDSLILRTASSAIALGISRFGVRKTVTVSTMPVATASAEEVAIESRKPRWLIMDGNIGYVHMGLLMQNEVAAMMTALRNTRAIVFDVRNYPNGTLYLIAERLNPEPRVFVGFTRPQYDRPGTSTWYLTLNAGPTTATSSYYRGKVILLGDERTQSHAEFTMMALRTAPDVSVIGSPTSGADGNVSQIALPGGIRTYFSGLGVFYPDGRPTQRVGIVPDTVVVPTIQGIQNGVDEVLERALSLVR